jgi:hypothetical protein
MSTPLWKFDIRSSTIALTHDSVHAHWLAYVQDLRSQTPPNMSVGQVDRCSEIILMGMRLCDVKMGTAAEINEFIDKRLQEIDQETRPFLPDPLERGSLLRSSPYAQSSDDRGVEDTGREDDIRSEESSLPVRHRSDSLIGNDDDEEWENDFSHSNEEDRSSPLRGLPFRAQLLSATRNPWSVTQSKLVEARKQFDSFYAESGVEKDVLYTKTFAMLQGAIKCAYQRPPWVDPVKLWLDTELAYQALIELSEDVTEERIEDVLAAARAEEQEGRKCSF